METKKTPSKHRLDKWLALAAIIIIIFAWLAGRKMEKADLDSSLRACIPAAEKFDNIGHGSFEAFDSTNNSIGFITLESSDGYGGPVVLAVGVDAEGEIIGLSILSSKETPSYLQKVLSHDYLNDLIGKSYNDNYELGYDVDVVSGATYSSKAIYKSAQKGQRYIASKYLEYDLPPMTDESVMFGMPEIILLLLFIAGFIAQRKTFKHKKAVRWGTMLTGLFVLGFYYNMPLSLSYINQLLMGYFPSWNSHIYWYLILGGIFLLLTITNKNPYCYWFCPFGAAQECIGKIGGAKVKSPGRYKNFFKWTQRLLAFGAIITALLLRNPGVTSYEVFGTLFKFTGSNLQFTLLGIVLIASLFIKRPWCAYLCPIKAVMDYLISIRKWIISLWKREKRTV